MRVLFYLFGLSLLEINVSILRILVKFQVIYLLFDKILKGLISYDLMMSDQGDVLAMPSIFASIDLEMRRCFILLKPHIIFAVTCVSAGFSGFCECSSQSA